jgi:hypothetical protein
MGEPHRHRSSGVIKSFNGFEEYSVAQRQAKFAKRKGLIYPLSKEDEAKWLHYVSSPTSFESLTLLLS